MHMYLRRFDVNICHVRAFTNHDNGAHSPIKCSERDCFVIHLRVHACTVNCSASSSVHYSSLVTWFLYADSLKRTSGAYIIKKADVSATRICFSISPAVYDGYVYSAADHQLQTGCGFRNIRVTPRVLARRRGCHQHAGRDNRI